MSVRRTAVFLSLFSAVALVVPGCFLSPTAPEKENNRSSGKLYIAQSDFATGMLEWLDMEQNAISLSNISIHNDAALRKHGGSLYVIERFGAGNIMKIDPSASVASAIVYQENLGLGRNPQDIVFISGTKSYVSYENEPEITIFNPLSGTISGAIDISSYTFNPGGNTSPNAGAMHIAGSDLFVLLQRRDGWAPGAPTLLLKIDTDKDSIVDTMSLTYKNGYGMAYHEGALYVSNPGNAYETGDGAVEKVDIATGAVSVIIDEDELGGSPNEIVHKEGSRFYLMVYVGWGEVKVVEIDAVTGAIVATLPGVIDGFGGIYYDKPTQTLYVGERDSEEMGVRVFRNNVQAGQTVKSAVSLPPSSLVVVR